MTYNYPLYNTLPYRQRYPPVRYGGYQRSAYDHLIQSTAEKLLAFTAPSESSISNNHRLVNKPSGATNSKHMYYCETCRVECSDHNSYQAHLNGTKHKKKEINSQNHQQLNQNTYRCELCDITCSGSSSRKAHLVGSKHAKAMKLYQKLGKTISQESQTVTDNQQSIENSNELIGIEYIETFYDNKNLPKSYYCKICDCNFGEVKSKDAHLRGKRHRNSYKEKVNNTNPKQTIEDVDEDMKYLMNLHEQIIPTQNFLDNNEAFVSAVEVALKSCSDTFGTVLDKPSLMGVSRVGSFMKNLIVKSDRMFHVVVICTEWPTMSLFEKIFSILPDNFQETWKDRISLQCDKENEIIQVNIDTNIGQISVSIAFTSLSIQQDVVQPTEHVLTKTNCLKALDAIHSVQWFQNQVSAHKHASALIRCLRYKTKISQYWQSLSSEAIEILIEYTLSKSVSVISAFRRVMEYLSGGLVLSNGPGLRTPWQSDSIKDVFDNLNAQQRSDITHEAQMGLRFLAFGQINKWFERSEKRPYFDQEDRIPSKRQCIKLEPQ